MPDKPTGFNVSVRVNVKAKHSAITISPANFAAVRLLKVLSVLILFVAVMETQRRIRKRLFVRNMRSYKAKRRIRMAYHHLVPVFTARSVVYRGQSMAEYTAQIAEAMAMPEQDIAVFVALVYHARFGPDTIGEEELRLFGEMYYRITNKIYEDVTFIKRLYYMYIMVL